MRNRTILVAILATTIFILATGVAWAQVIGVINLNPGEKVDAACIGGGNLVLNRLVKLPDGSNDKSQGRLVCKQTNSPTEEPTEEPTATATALPPTAEPTATATPEPPPGPGASAPNWAASAGMVGEYGMSPDTHQKLRADAATGEFDRACTDAEHDPNQWHTLLNYANDNQPGGPCHFDHQHGDNPHAVNDLFGPVGQSFGVTSSISYPWQTYAADAGGNPTLDADGSPKWENEYKHAGYFWIVRRGQCANGDPSYCVDAFRVQVHASAMGVGTRWHSFSAEIRACTNGNNPATCNNAQIGGWIDTFALFTPTYAQSAPGLCDNPFNAAYFGNRANINDFGLSNQFVPRDDPDLQDEQRCHRRLPAGTAATYPNGLPYNDVSYSAPAEWWHHTLWDFRYNVFFYDPFAETDGNGNLTFYCAADDTACRWNQSRITGNIDYVFPVMSWHNGFRGYVTRFGDNGRNCTAAGLDCIYADYSRVPRNPNGLGYIHTRDGERQSGGRTEPMDHDITPAGRPSWITWFRSMAGMPMSMSAAVAASVEPPIGSTVYMPSVSN